MISLLSIVIFMEDFGLRGYTDLKPSLIVGIVFLYALILFFQFLRGYNYFHFSDIGDKIVLKHFNLSAMNRKYLQYDIPKDSFYKFAITKTNLGIRKNLTLYMKVKGKIKNYPPVSVSTLSKQDISS